MSQEEQPRKPKEEQQQEPIKYGDVFQVSGELAKKPIAPGDAANMQAAETTAFGQFRLGGPAAVMEAAAVHNVAGGLVGDAASQSRREGVTVVETRVVTEFVDGQVVGEYAVEATPIVQMTATGEGHAALTIGEALEALAKMVGDKPVDYSDAAGIMAAECRATGCHLVSPGGLATMAQSAAAFNAGLAGGGDVGNKVKLKDILTGARAKLTADKAATREDADGIMAAELRSNPNSTTMHPGGVAAAVAQAVKMNETAPGTTMFHF